MINTDDSRTSGAWRIHVSFLSHPSLLQNQDDDVRPASMRRYSEDSGDGTNHA